MKRHFLQLLYSPKQATADQPGIDIFFEARINFLWHHLLRRPVCTGFICISMGIFGFRFNHLHKR